MFGPISTALRGRRGPSHGLARSSRLGRNAFSDARDPAPRAGLADQNPRPYSRRIFRSFWPPPGAAGPQNASPQTPRRETGPRTFSIFLWAIENFVPPGPLASAVGRRLPRQSGGGGRSFPKDLSQRSRVRACPQHRPLDRSRRPRPLRPPRPLLLPDRHAVRAAPRDHPDALLGVVRGSRGLPQTTRPPPGV